MTKRVQRPRSLHPKLRGKTVHASYCYSDALLLESDALKSLELLLKCAARLGEPQTLHSFDTDFVGLGILSQDGYHFTNVIIHRHHPCICGQSRNQMGLNAGRY